MLSVLLVQLPSPVPIAGCELSPYVLLLRSDFATTTDDIPEVAPVDGYFLRWRWYRIHSDRRVTVCSVHPFESAALQCLECEEAKHMIYHCSPKCFSDSWCHHRDLHARARARAASYAVRDNGAEGSEDPLIQRYSHNGAALAALSGIPPHLSSYPSRILFEHVRGNSWVEVGFGRTYTPTAEDVGHQLWLECVPMYAKMAARAVPVGPARTVLTYCVIPAPSRRLISADGTSAMDLEGRIPARGTFSLLSYNVLADLYVTRDKHSYCPAWALSWAYRKQNLLREILSYGADILCLQEVQSDQFKEFFAPELAKHGYAGAYKKRTTEVYTRTSYYRDGCATFFRRDRFSLVQEYEDNVALITILEVRDRAANFDLSQAAGGRQLLCVANTYIRVNPEFKGIQLWQLRVLMKSLEIASSASIPMLVAGDFNAVPGSAPHSLMTNGRVDWSTMRLYRQIPLVSAYSQFARMHGMSPLMKQQRRRIDTTTNEPLFTNFTRDFLGTLDYIFYTADSLDVESLLELLDEENLRKEFALPSPEWSSDHIALLVEFRFKSRPTQ